MSRKLIKYLTESTGVELWVQPLSPFTFRGIRQKAFEKFPEPDSKPFEKPMPNAALEGEMIPGTESPEWQNLAAAQARKRNDHIIEAQIIVACDPTPDKSTLVNQFADDLKTVAQWSTLPDDPWHATLLHGILRGKNEPQDISDIASEDLPLTEDEVVEGVARFFRRSLSRPAVAKLARQASGV